MKRTATGEQMQSFCPWQECHDESSGYPYYWNMTTNEVTWEMPAEYQLALQKWQLLQQQLAASDKKSADNSAQISSASVIEKLEAGKNKLNNNRKGSALTKKSYPMDSDSEDEKIELITSYGSDSSDDSDSESCNDSKSSTKKSPVDSSKSKSSVSRVSKPSSKPDVKSTNTNVYGPCFPPDRPLKMANSPEETKARSISLVPYADTSDVMNSDESFSSYSNSNKSGSNEGLVVSSKTVSNDVKLKSETGDSNASNHKVVISDEEEGDDEEDEEDEFEEDESLILSKLRSQAMVLKQLGGEIPDEIKCLIDSENPDIGIDDIIALIENETPPDHTEKSNCDKNLLLKEPVRPVDKRDSISEDKIDAAKPISVTEQFEDSSDKEKELAKVNQASSFALIAGYGDDSDQDEASSPTKSSAQKRKALFPIDEKHKSHAAIKAELSMKPVFKKIKLSARAKALINASIITAKARATPLINHSGEAVAGAVPNASNHSSKPEEKLVEPSAHVKDAVMTNEMDLPDSKKVPKEEIKSPVSEKVELPELKKIPEVQKQDSEKQTTPLGNGPTAVSQALPKLKLSTSTIVSYSKPLITGLETSTPQSSSYTAVWDTATTYATDEKRGFGFSNDAKPAASSSFSCYHSKSEKKEGIQFIKAETININPPAPVPPVVPSLTEISKEESVDRKEIESLSELIVEKVKYLGEGKEPVSPVQIMTIQIETLVSAWQASCLTGKYLLDWLNATSKQLSSLEEEAAPLGWKCEWDRSFSRYYYRNKETGIIQWEYPVDKESEEVLEEVEMELCDSPPPPSAPIPVPPPPVTPPPPPEDPPLPKTPPPPVISFSPPPPPIISMSAASNKKSVLPKKKSKIASLSIELPPLPSSPPPSPKNPPPPLPDTPLPPLPPPPSSTSPRVNIPLPPSANSHKKQKTVDKFNQNNAQYYSPQQAPPPPPSQPPPSSQLLPPLQLSSPSQPAPPLPSTTAPPRPLFPAVSQQPPLPLSHGHAPKSFSNHVPDNLSHQVIGTPAVMSQPPLPPAKADLNSALDSFYSDIASLEATVPEESSRTETPPVLLEQAAPGVPTEPEPTSVPKKKKKVKLSAGLTLKKKGLDSLVAKWEKVHKSVCD